MEDTFGAVTSTGCPSLRHGQGNVTPSKAPGEHNPEMAKPLNPRVEGPSPLGGVAHFKSLTAHSSPPVMTQVRNMLVFKILCCFLVGCASAMRSTSSQTSSTVAQISISADPLVQNVPDGFVSFNIHLDNRVNHSCTNLI